MMGGHKDQKGLFFINRAELEPPEGLQKMIFPFIEEAQRTINVGNRTASSFLKLLQRLRSVILQDAASFFLSDRWNHYIFQNLDIFKTDAFLSFASQLRAKMSEASDPADASVESVLPGVSSRLDNLQKSLKPIQNEMNGMNSKFDSMLHDLDRKFDSMRHDLSILSSFMAHIRSFQPVAHPAPSDCLPALPARSLPSVDDSLPTPTDENSRPERVYNLCIKHGSIFDMWDEWHGMGRFRAEVSEFCYPGGIDALEKEKGFQWRRHFSCSQQKQFSRTKFIINKIKETISSQGDISQDIILQRFQEIFILRKLSLSSMEAFLKGNDK
jgi:hypothetical protein